MTKVCIFDLVKCRRSLNIELDLQYSLLGVDVYFMANGGISKLWYTRLRSKLHIMTVEITLSDYISLLFFSLSKRTQTMLKKLYKKCLRTRKKIAFIHRHLRRTNTFIKKKITIKSICTQKIERDGSKERANPKINMIKSIQKRFCTCFIDDNFVISRAKDAKHLHSIYKVFVELRLWHSFCFFFPKFFYE